MHTIDKVVVTTWILFMFLLIWITASNSYSDNNECMDNLEESLVIFEPVNSIIDRTELLVYSDMLDLRPRPQSEYIFTGKCGTDNMPEEYQDHTIYEERETLVADPLHGKDLYIFYIAQITEQYYPNVDPYIALAVLEIESDYHPDIVSGAGAVGLMQVIPKYHARRVVKYGLNDLMDPYTNIICGVDFLNELYEKRGSWSSALLGYNNSTSYVNKVLTRADNLRKDGYFG